MGLLPVLFLPSTLTYVSVTIGPVVILTYVTVDGGKTHTLVWVVYGEGCCLKLFFLILCRRIKRSDSGSSSAKEEAALSQLQALLRTLHANVPTLNLREVRNMLGDRAKLSQASQKDFRAHERSVRVFSGSQKK